VVVQQLIKDELELLLLENIVDELFLFNENLEQQNRFNIDEFLNQQHLRN
jgi:hypothetical protein